MYLNVELTIFSTVIILLIQPLLSDLLKFIPVPLPPVVIRSLKIHKIINEQVSDELHIFDST